MLHADTQSSAGLPIATAILIAEAPDAALDARDALETAGVRLAVQLRFDAAPAQFEQHRADLILIEGAGIADARVEAVLARCDALAAEQDAGIVATLEEAQLDLAAAQRLGPRAQILCRPSAAERLSATILARARPHTRLHDSSRDGEAARLQRLNDEVTRIAEILSRLAHSEGVTTPNALREPVSGYRGPDDEPPGGITAAEVRATIRARRMRNQFFAPDLFADPAWDMLLDLFAAELEGRRVSVSSLCIAASVPPTTALRWIGALHDAGLFERQADPTDRRRAYIALSAKGVEAMRLYAAAVKRSGLPLA